MDYKEDMGIVRNMKGNLATVEVVKTDACESCSMTGICGASHKTVTHKIQTQMILQPGDRVKLHISAGAKLFSSVLLFIFPIIFMVIFYFLGKSGLGISENYSILLSFLGLLLSGIIIYFIDKIYAGKIHIEISEKLEKENENTSE